MQYLELDPIEFNPLKVITYEKYVRSDDYSQRILSTTGLLSNEKKKIHKYLGFNKFSKESYQVPLKSEGWIGTYERIIKDYEEEEEEEYHKENNYEMELTFEKFFIEQHDQHKNM